MNYLISSRQNGEFSVLGIEGAIRTCFSDRTVDDATVAALKKLRIGEYVYIGNYVVTGVRYNGGRTIDELQKR